MKQKKKGTCKLYLWDNFSIKLITYPPRDKDLQSINRGTLMLCERSETRDWFMHAVSKPHAYLFRVPPTPEQQIELLSSFGSAIFYKESDSNAWSVCYKGNEQKIQFSALNLNATSAYILFLNQLLETYLSNQTGTNFVNIENADDLRQLQEVVNFLALDFQLISYFRQSIDAQSLQRSLSNTIGDRSELLLDAMASLSTELRLMAAEHYLVNPKRNFHISFSCSFVGTHHYFSLRMTGAGDQLAFLDLEADRKDFSEPVDSIEFDVEVDSETFQTFMTNLKNNAKSLCLLPQCVMRRQSRDALDINTVGLMLSLVEFSGINALIDRDILETTRDNQPFMHVLYGIGGVGIAWNAVLSKNTKYCAYATPEAFFSFLHQIKKQQGYRLNPFASISEPGYLFRKETTVGSHCTEVFRIVTGNNWLSKQYTYRVGLLDCLLLRPLVSFPLVELRKAQSFWRFPFYLFSTPVHLLQATMGAVIMLPLLFIVLPHYFCYKRSFFSERFPRAASSPGQFVTQGSVRPTSYESLSSSANEATPLVPEDSTPQKSEISDNHVGSKRKDS